MVLGLGLFFSSEKVQTQVASQLTQRINKTYTTNISIGKARINLNGEIGLQAILILDHRKDSLLYINTVSMDLEELEGVLKGAYQLTSLTIDQPALYLKTYANDTVSNLAQFLTKFKRNNAQKKNFDAGIEHLRLNGGKLLLENENNKSSTSLHAINLSANSLDYVNDTLEAAIENMSFQRNKGIPLSSLSGQLYLTANKLALKKLFVESNSSFVRGDLVLDTPDFSMASLLNSAAIDLNVKESHWATSLLPSKYIKTADNNIALAATAKGPLADLELDFDLGLKHQTKIAGNAIINYGDTQNFTTQLEELTITLNKDDLALYLADSLQSQLPLMPLNWNDLEVRGGGKYTHNVSAESLLKVQLNEGVVDIDLAAKKTEEGWQLNQNLIFTEFGKGNLVDSNNELILNGALQLQANLAANTKMTFEAEGGITSFYWNERQFNAIQFSSEVTNEKRTLSLTAKDSRSPIALSFRQDLTQVDHPYQVSGNIKGLNLSAFGWTPPDDAVRLFSDLQISGNKDALTALKLKQITVKNRLATHAFSNVDFRFKQDQSLKTVQQLEAREHPFVFKGNFEYSSLGLLIENALREAFLLPKRGQPNENENLIFDFTLDKEVVKALYPKVVAPENIRFKGELSAQQEQSNFEFDLPYIAYLGYRFQDISFTSSLKNLNEITYFQAKKIEGKNFTLANVFLTTRNENNQLKGALAGQFGKSEKRDFLIDFTYQQEEENARFDFNTIDLNLGKNKWSIDNSSPTLSYNNNSRSVQFSDFSLSSAEQFLRLEGYYQSEKDYSLQMKTRSLDLAEALPVGDKFNFAGLLNASINLTENSEQQTRAANLTIDELVINTVAMGDFDFAMEGSSQLKTYPIQLGLVQENDTPLKGSGTLFTAGEQPNLSLDLNFDAFNIAFLSALGKDKLTGIEGKLSGLLNLWGSFDDLKLQGNALLAESELYIPSTNVRYGLGDNTQVLFRNRSIDFPKANLFDTTNSTTGILSGQLRHYNFNAWELDLDAQSERLLVYDRPEDPEALFYGNGYLNGRANFSGPTKLLTLEVTGSTAEGTTLVIPWKEDKGLSDTSFIDFLHKGDIEQETVTADISDIDEAFRGFEMLFNLDVNRNAEVEIVVDQSSGSTLSGRGAGNILIETNIDGKFNIWGDFIAYDGIYNFKNLGLIDKKFAVKQGGTIVWEGDPLEAQLNIEATYQVPGGANPALLVDNPNFNRKIPTNVDIQLIGNLIKPDDPVFDITFPNTTGIVVSEINYRLADQQRRQLQAISLLSQGIFISDVSVSFQGITNNLYEKASDVFSTLIGANEGKLNVGLNYLQGEENPNFDLRTEDRIGLTLSTQISDRILINGKIGVPIDGVQETVIVGDVQIDFILNESGTLKAKVFNRENDFRYLGDEFGYTQGMGMSYQVDFNTFQELIEKIKSNASKSADNRINLPSTQAIDFVQKEN